MWKRFKGQSITDENQYQVRRDRLAQRLGQDSIAIIPAATEKRRSNDVFYPFRQNSDFYYLTEFKEPNALMILIPSNGGSRFILFNQPDDPKTAVWIGSRIGQERACKDYGADQAYPIAEANEHIPQLLLNKKTIYFPIGYSKAFEQKVMKWIDLARQSASRTEDTTENLQNLSLILHEMRIIKDDVEIEKMRTAAKLSAEGHVRAMQICQPGMTEYQLSAVLYHEFIRQGSLHMAYDPIVATGRNACILHYTANESIMNDGEVVLIDAGGEYEYYASDVSRTFPVNGRFNGYQKALYELVLDTQLQIIKAIKPGKRYDMMQKLAVNYITQGLIDLGLLRGSLADLIETQAYKQFYMHSSGHWLGLDVHDVGEYHRDDLSRKLEPGMVVTVEPGIYCPPELSTISKGYRAVGIRIEDDVLITKNGCEVLSDGAPKTVEDIESVMRHAKYY